MRLYVIGPVTGRQDLNKPAFLGALRELSKAGYLAHIPHSFVPEYAEWEGAMRISIARMLECDGVALLDGWNASRGARIEYDLARDLGMPAYAVGHWVANAEHYLKGETE